MQSEESILHNRQTTNTLRMHVVVLSLHMTWNNLPLRKTLPYGFDPYILVTALQKFQFLRCACLYSSQCKFLFHCKITIIVAEQTFAGTKVIYSIIAPVLKILHARLLQYCSTLTLSLFQPTAILKPWNDLTGEPFR